MSEGYNETGPMADDQRDREHAARAIVKDAEESIRAAIKKLYEASSMTDICAPLLSDCAEEIENALSDFLPSDPRWLEILAKRRQERWVA